MNKFDETYQKLMEMLAGSGGAFGDGASIGGSFNPDGGPIAGGDSYAPGDARMPKVIGAKEVATKGTKKKKEKNKNHKMEFTGGSAEQAKTGKVTMNIQRRVFPNM